MRKIIILFSVALPLMFLSCKKTGSISGVATYYFNETQGDKPDVGAKVYLTKENVDSVKYLLEAYSLKDDIERYKLYITSCRDLIDICEKNINSARRNNDEIQKYRDEISKTEKEKRDLEAKIEKLETELKEGICDSELDIIGNYMDIITSDKTKQTTVDGAGNYSFPQVEIGDYFIIFTSNGIQKPNRLGNVKIREVKVEPKTNTNEDVRFDL